MSHLATLNERIKALEERKVPTEQNYKIDVLLASFDAKMKARDYIDLSYTGDVSACEKCKVESKLQPCIAACMIYSPVFCA
jgi:hypothetical protein